MKALILAAGRGKRLDELSVDNNKCMVRIMDRPVIEYSLDCVVSTDIDQIIIIIGYRAEDVINHLGNYYKGKKLRYVIQAEQKGLVHAIESAREALAGEDFMLLLGDEILINPKHKEMIDLFNTNDLFGICGILRVDDKNLIKRTYCLIQDENNNIFRLIEKPRKPLNNYMGTGDCIFRNQIFQYIEYTPIHHERKEKELPDLIQCAIDDGNSVKSFIICDKYTNINTQEDIIMAEGFFR
ncbi:MAG TPA: nucleotidyltransferase family protein [Spirochaetota bacterium]|nr:nucleotidyltransferase family protein [Spirochaetota bacterium]HOD13451.1 nucleotidyltransferase family protein [Spirochaetota bacterium]HPN10583.1 nucleotidyltransferase family protein [Spirochaetota bacterium]HQL83622.1 nucleotidyltransferase family protein [Spirochaetota bacterium]